VPLQAHEGHGGGDTGRAGAGDHDVERAGRGGSHGRGEYVARARQNNRINVPAPP
jgi:hypothetical protein